ncbi:dienelactone hydrolase family protein [Variovorax sp. J22G21]|uniref:dienelactone hydrolase family protein n=1 Tax=Variovorax fucosicus TaxID=3053517 RepID=UPI002575F3B4|nr:MULTISPECIES: dienelactone hydrolase family protein [unclassified Variovorax]MDM0040008.1 dienelactone hydrolase family protein [Variovorax sp. J22R193]MDM0061381.1 dienelactone hydrolase family protein [Variovorax sp. J22G21]
MTMLPDFTRSLLVSVALSVTLLVAGCSTGVTTPSAAAGQLVHFTSLDGSATQLDGYLFRAKSNGQDRQPAIVFLHGCGGLLGRTGAINARELDWAARLNDIGITVLMVDSFGPRHHGEMCAPAHFDPGINRARPHDAYAALEFLQKQAYVQPNRIGVIGWSQGGGAVLNTIRADSRGRPAALPAGDFRAAAAFYPGSCSTAQQGTEWRSAIPLLVLIGEKDVWTPLAPCRALMDSRSPTTQVTMRAYPGAYHDFDWPNMRIHEMPAFRTRAGVVPIAGTDEAARADALRLVVGYFAKALQADDQPNAPR